MLLSVILALALSGRSDLDAAAPLELSPRRHSLEQILDALRTIESGGHADEGRNARGDGGRAIGPFQIHRAHWQDSRLPGRFEDCRDPSYARREVIAYWQRWCPDALERLDAEVLARVHNGGPKGALKNSTLGFWRKVNRVLEQEAQRPPFGSSADRARNATPTSSPTPAVWKPSG